MKGFPLSNTTTFSANPLGAPIALCAKDEVVSLEWVAPLALGLGSVQLKLVPASAGIVDLLWDGFQVFRVYTTRNMAKVVNRKSVRDGFPKPGVREAVGEDAAISAPSKAEHSVSSGEAAPFPKPAAIWSVFNKGHETIKGVFHMNSIQHRVET